MGVNMFDFPARSAHESIQLGNNYFERLETVYGVAGIIPVGTILAFNTTTGKYVPLNIAGTDGTNIAKCIVTDPATFATTTETRLISTVTGGRIDMTVLKYPASATTDLLKKSIQDDLIALGFELEFTNK